MENQNQRQSAFGEFISGIPFATRVLISINVLIALIFTFVSNPYQISICLNCCHYRQAGFPNFDCIFGASNCVNAPCWLGIFSAAWFHVGILHLAMNMLSLFYLGRRLEQKFGSICTFGLVVLFNFLSGLLYLLLSFLAGFFYHNFWYSNAIGFSGILFAMLMVDCQLSAGQSRSLFGMVAVPVWIYPWVSLALISFILPGVSFLGHLAGILIGWIYSKGYLGCFSLSNDRVREFEDKSFMSAVINMASFSRCALEPVIPSAEICGGAMLPRFDVNLPSFLRRRPDVELDSGSGYIPVVDSGDVGLSHQPGGIRGHPLGRKPGSERGEINILNMTGESVPEACAPMEAMNGPPPPGDDTEAREIQLAIELSLREEMQSRQ
eukprot:259068_1